MIFLKIQQTRKRLELPQLYKGHQEKPITKMYLKINNVTFYLKVEELHRDTIFKSVFFWKF